MRAELPVPAAPTTERVESFSTCVILAQVDTATAEQHLVAINGALRAGFEASIAPIRDRYWFGIAALGPAAVLWRATWRFDGRGPWAAEFTVLRVLVAVLALGALVSYVADSDRTVVPLAPVMGGPTTRWLFLASFAMSFGVVFSMGLVEFVDYRPLALLSYVVLALVPRYAYRRHSTALRESYP